MRLLPIIDVALCLHGESLDPALITEILGVTPTDERKKDEKKLTASGRAYTAKSGLWELYSEDPSCDLECRLRWLQEKIGEHKCLLSMPSVEYVKVYIYVDLASRGRDAETYETRLDSNQLEWISKIGAALELVLTYTANDEMKV